MALSEREQRLIGQIEQELAADDPRLARRMGMRGTHRRLLGFVIAGVSTVTLGVVLVVLALSIDSVLLGEAGFVTLIAGAYIATVPCPASGLISRARRARGGSTD